MTAVRVECSLSRDFCDYEGRRGWWFEDCGHSPDTGPFTESETTAKDNFAAHLKRVHSLNEFHVHALWTKAKDDSRNGLNRQWDKPRSRLDGQPDTPPRRWQ